MSARSLLQRTWRKYLSYLGLTLKNAGRSLQKSSLLFQVSQTKNSSTSHIRTVLRYSHPSLRLTLHGKPPSLMVFRHSCVLMAFSCAQPPSSQTRQARMAMTFGDTTTTLPFPTRSRFRKLGSTISRRFRRFGALIPESMQPWRKQGLVVLCKRHRLILLRILGKDLNGRV